MAELWPFIQLLVKKWRLEEKPLPLDPYCWSWRWTATFDYYIIRTGMLW